MKFYGQKKEEEMNEAARGCEARAGKETECRVMTAEVKRNIPHNTPGCQVNTGKKGMENSLDETVSVRDMAAAGEALFKAIGRVFAPETVQPPAPPLTTYHAADFKFFQCRADKTPETRGDWRQPRFHLSLEAAAQAQADGRMIGAWIPADIIVLDLDRHAGAPDGLATFDRILMQRKIEPPRTFTVRTMSGGLHLIFSCPGHSFRQGPKGPGIDLKTHSGYVIAAGSPGYFVRDVKPIHTLPDGLVAWLRDCERPAPTPTRPIQTRTALSLDRMADIMAVQGYTWTPGTRNHCAWRLALWACKSGISPAEVTAWIVSHHGAGDFPECEIQKTVASAFRTQRTRSCRHEA